MWHDGKHGRRVFIRTELDSLEQHGEVERRIPWIRVGVGGG